MPEKWGKYERKIGLAAILMTSRADVTYAPLRTQPFNVKILVVVRQEGRKKLRRSRNRKCWSRSRRWRPIPDRDADQRKPERTLSIFFGQVSLTAADCQCFETCFCHCLSRAAPFLATTWTFLSWLWTFFDWWNFFWLEVRGPAFMRDSVAKLKLFTRSNG